MYQVIDSDNNVLADSNNLIDILTQFRDIVKTYGDMVGDIVNESPTRVTINCWYPDYNQQLIVEIVKFQ